MKTVSIISGGLDSLVATAIAKDLGYEVIALHFNYAQRTEQKELKCFRDICDFYQITNRYELDIDFFKKIGANALVDKSIAVPTTQTTGVPNTYVPFRNGIFLSIAAAVAEKENAQFITIGVVEEDSSGYPDCTEKFINLQQNAINQGTKEETKIAINAPVIYMSKAEIVQKAFDLNAPLEMSWSCYQGEKKACGVCDSCRLRLNGFKVAGKVDPIVYETNQF